MPIALDESQITPIIGNLGQVNDMSRMLLHFQSSCDRAESLYDRHCKNSS